MKKYLVRLLLVTILFLAHTTEAQKSNMEPDRIGQGRQIYLRILNSHPNIDSFYQKPTLWGGMTATPLAVISVPITDWEALSENERKLLSEYAASLVDDVKGDPFGNSPIPAKAPAAPKIRENASRMTPKSWGIMAGRISDDGRDILSDKIVRSGTSN
ncbi:MAG: hypothetical protein WAW37_04300 [Syntrophobacteraceae bacterium]